MTETPQTRPRTFTLSDFDFALPPERIAQHPTAERSASRLLDGRSLPPVDRIFHTLPGLLQAGDLLVFNDTRVVKARLFGEKASGGKLELADRARAHWQRGGGPHEGQQKPLPGSTVHLAGGLGAGGFDGTLLGRWPDAQGPLFRFALHGPAHESPWDLMERHGHLPLPPYIERQQHTGNDPDAVEDSQRYQTVFARAPGAVAAPPPHCILTKRCWPTLARRGIERASVTLHVGAGTFQPVKTENLAEHQMHSEWYEVPLATLAALERCRQRGGRVVAVGTTTVRTLESWARSGWPRATPISSSRRDSRSRWWTCW